MRYLIFIITIFFLDITNIYSNLNCMNSGFSTPINLYNLNSKEDDFAPIYNTFENILYFNSTTNDFSKFYITKLSNIKNDTNIFSNKKLLNSPINEKRENRSYITFIDDKNAILSAFYETPNGLCLSLYKSTIEKNSWSTPSILQELLDTSFSAHPTVSPNGKMLIFASTKYKNIGHKDIDLWLSYKQDDDTWGMLTSINELNSVGDEITPYFVSDSLLIFASNGFYGPGNFDLYYSFLSDGIWSNPLPINDINTEFNESDPTILPDGSLIFASDRPGGKGKLDLYIAKQNIPQKKLENDLLVISSPISNIEITKNIKYNLVNSSYINIPNNLNSQIVFQAMPKIIQLNINFKEKLKIDSLYGIFWDKDTVNIDTNTKTILYNLNNLDELSNYDSLKITIFAKTSNGITISNDFFIFINKKEHKELIKHTINNKSYYRAFTYFNINNNIDNIDVFYEENKNIIDKLNSIYSKNIIIIIYNNNNLPKKIIKKIETLFKNKNIKIENINSDDFNNNTIEFRIEV